LVMNRKGESLFAVGVQSLPDIIEEARMQFDVNAKNQVRENLSVKLAIDNLNDATVEYSQGDEYVRKFKKGRTASASLSYTF
jgi:outer membrane receptor protein involved in Fe transport